MSSGQKPPASAGGVVTPLQSAILLALASPCVSVGIYAWAVAERLP